MKRSFVFILVLMTAVGLTIQCGGGGGGGGMSVAKLEGTWFGVVRDNVENAHTMEMTIDASGIISDIYLDAKLMIGLSGTVANDSGNIFGFVMSDGLEGGFMADDSATHMGYLDEDFLVGVLQKGASNVPSYAGTDFQGTWSGYSIWLDADLEIVESGSTNMTIDATYDAVGTVLIGTFDGYIAGWSPPWGIAWGWDDTETYYFEVLMSTDKQFVATWSCEDVVETWYVEDCEFGVWSKQ